MNRPATALAFALICSSTAALGHPGQGIAVDAQGVFFLDTGAGVWRLDLSGKLAKVPGSAYHWLALDRTGRLSKTKLPHIPNGEIARTEYGLLLSSDVPISIDAKGALYFPRKSDGKLHIVRLEPNGSSSEFAAVAPSAQGKPLGWINGSAIGRDGTFYYTEDFGVWKITPQGKTVAAAVAIYAGKPKERCDSTQQVGFEIGPAFRGIDIDATGNLWIAATGCRAIVKITPDNQATTLVETTGAWSPTGVATFEDEVYVLEYLHTPGHNRRDWIPRIRKIAADGTHRVIATVERK